MTNFVIFHQKRAEPEFKLDTWNPYYHTRNLTFRQIQNTSCQNPNLQFEARIPNWHRNVWQEKYISRTHKIWNVCDHRLPINCSLCNVNALQTFTAFSENYSNITHNKQNRNCANYCEMMIPIMNQNPKSICKEKSTRSNQTTNSFPKRPSFVIRVYSWWYCWYTFPSLVFSKSIFFSNDTHALHP